MARETVLVLSAYGANDAVRGQMNEYGYALDECGANVLHLSIEPDDLQQAVNLVGEGKVAFVVAWLGAAQDLEVKNTPYGESRNIWEAYGIPFLKIQGDLPAYFSHRHRDVPVTTVNLYASPEYAYFRKRWLPDARGETGIIPPLPLAPADLDDVDSAARRKGKLVFIKNGNAPDELRQLWREQLSPLVAELLSSLAEELVPLSLKAGLFHIGDLVAERLEARGLVADTAPYAVRFLCAQLDDYLRRVKSRMIAEAILDLPVIVQGSFWHHLDFRGKRATLVEGKTYEATAAVYREQLGIVDMSPNTDLTPHERVQRAAGSFALFLTNRQTWLEKDFPECRELLFDFSPESIRQRVSDVIARPARYLELGVAFGEQFRARYPREAFGHRVLEFAQLVALQWQDPKPKLQPFFVWPGPRER
jgi:hypothetical protein